MKKRIGLFGMTIAMFVVLFGCLTLDSKAATQESGYVQPQVTEVAVEEYSDDVYQTGYARRDSVDYWSKYASTYYYKQMNANQRAFYDDLYQMAMSYLTGTGDITGGNSVNGGADGAYTPGVVYQGLDKDTAINTAITFVNSNPQFYFLDGEDYVREYVMGQENAGAIYIDVYDDFADGIARQIATEQFKNKIENWLKQVNAETTLLNKEKKIHDLIVDNTIYEDGSPYNQSCYSVFINGKTVCSGYAEAFELLCNGVGIETIIVTSTTHEWNQVHFGNYWYGVDPTWDDTSASYRYYNISDESMQRNNRSHVPEVFWSKVNRPICQYDYGKETAEPVSKPYTAVYGNVDYSSVFDPYYYADRYTDLKNAFGYQSEKLLEHFVKYGMSEGRQAKQTFNVASYRMQYADLRNAYGNNLRSYYLHYVNYGSKEGRRGTGCTTLQGATSVYNGVNYAAVYDYAYYTSHNPDVLKAFGQDDRAVLEHFVKYGMSEGRQAKQTFQVWAYRQRYADLQAAYGNRLKDYYIHYMNFGNREGRIGN